MKRTKLTEATNEIVESEQSVDKKTLDSILAKQKKDIENSLNTKMNQMVVKGAGDYKTHVVIAIPKNGTRVNKNKNKNITNQESTNNSSTSTPSEQSAANSTLKKRPQGNNSSPTNKR